MEITFSDPIYLWFIFIIPLFLFTHFYSFKFVKRRAIRLANFESIKRVSGAEKISLNWLVIIIRFFTILLLILSVSGMIIWYEGKSSDNSFIIAIDASGSMLAQDFTPNRLEAAKEAAILFVDGLETNTEVAVLSFSGIANIEKELSTNLIEVKDSIRKISLNSMHGTAIGDVIRVSLNIFSEQDKPRSIILLTDGRENVASEEEFDKIVNKAKEDKVTIHTIGIGTSSGGLLPGIEMISTIDDRFLQKIADDTGGKYYHVEDNERLMEAYKAISTTSESLIPFNSRVPFIFAALFFLFLEWGFLNTKFKSIP